MKKTFTDMVIFGSSFYGVSLLINSDDNVVLIDRGARIGDEFSASMRVNRCKKYPDSYIGKSFYNELKDSGYIKDGYICSAPSAFLLAKMAQGKHMMFKTEISEIVRENTTYCITVFNAEGYSCVITPLIIDTTSEGIFHTEDTEKFLNVMCEEKPRDTEAVYDVFTEKYIMSFKAECNEEVSETRKRLFSYLMKNKNCKAFYIADQYWYRIGGISKKIGEGYYWIPSSGFDNVIEAVDSGGDGYNGL